jgi:aspartate/methionine/tyrosine aminotransferase
MDLLTREEGVIDLAVGEPVFLRDAMEGFYPEKNDLRFIEPTYPEASGSPDLRHAIVRFLGRGDPHKIVVTNGCLQALSASMWALREVHVISGATAVTPYFPYFKPLAKLAGLHWMDEPGEADIPESVNVVAWPNNPSGQDPLTMAWPKFDISIWDAAYASPTYAWEGGIPEHYVEVGSAAKTFGLSSLRVGWAIFQNELVARKAAEYVEITTAGVSNLSQEFLRATLAKTERNPRAWQNRQTLARSELGAAGDEFYAMLGPYCDHIHGVPAGHGGMFAWFEPKDLERFDKALTDTKVKLVNGMHFGANFSWFRMNLGADRETLRHGLTLLKKELSK